MLDQRRRSSWIVPYLVFLAIGLLVPADADWNAARPHVWLAPDSDLWGVGLIPDVLLNVAIFVPIGLAFHRALRMRGAYPGVASLGVVFGAALFSVTIESLQYVLAWRHSSLIDVISNTAGAISGVALDIVMNGVAEGSARRAVSPRSAFDASRAS